MFHLVFSSDSLGIRLSSPLSSSPSSPLVISHSAPPSEDCIKVSNDSHSTQGTKEDSLCLLLIHAPVSLHSSQWKVAGLQGLQRSGSSSLLIHDLLRWILLPPFFTLHCYSCSHPLCFFFVFPLLLIVAIPLRNRVSPSHQNRSGLLFPFFPPCLSVSLECSPISYIFLFWSRAGSTQILEYKILLLLVFSMYYNLLFYS